MLNKTLKYIRKLISLHITYINTGFDRLYVQQCLSVLLTYEQRIHEQRFWSLIIVCEPFRWNVLMIGIMYNTCQCWAFFMYCTYLVASDDLMRLNLGKWLTILHPRIHATWNAYQTYWSSWHCNAIISITFISRSCESKWVWAFLQPECYQHDRIGKKRKLSCFYRLTERPASWRGNGPNYTYS